MVEQIAVVDLAGARLVAARRVGELHVRDAWQQVADGVAQLAFHALRVVDVVLQEHVVGAHFVHQGDGLARAVDEITRHVKRVDGLDQQRQAQLLRFGRGVAHIAHPGGARLRLAHARRLQTGHAVPALHADHRCVLGSLSHTGAELVLAAGDAGDAALARGPVAGRQVVQHEFEPVLLQQLGDGLGRKVVGEKELHGLEARFRCGAKSVEERQLVPEHGEVGGEAGHGVFFQFIPTIRRR
ncbi:hypothetical protein D9M68_728800 [compost metagenome]